MKRLVAFLLGAALVLGVGACSSRGSVVCGPCGETVHVAP